MAADRYVHHSLLLELNESAELIISCARLARGLTEKEGLKVMTRNHIHCAVGLHGEEGVTSGESVSKA